MQLLSETTHSTWESIRGGTAIWQMSLEIKRDTHLFPSSHKHQLYLTYPNFQLVSLPLKVEKNELQE